MHGLARLVFDLKARDLAIAYCCRLSAECLYSNLDSLAISALLAILSRPTDTAFLAVLPRRGWRALIVTLLLFIVVSLNVRASKEGRFGSKLQQILSVV